MAATRLSDGQKQEIAERYRAGASSNDLAQAFDCSPNTVSRVVKAALDPAEYEQLKQQRAKGGRLAPAAAPPAAAPVPAPVRVATPDRAPQPPRHPDGDDREALAVRDEGRHALAIEDADDFADDSADDDTVDGDTADEADDAGEGQGEGDDAFVAVPVIAFDQAQAQAQPQPQPLACQPFASASLAESVYMLVDKTVELQARPLREFTELGVLPEEEEERQALMVFINPRQAKRHCGRSQRVIKIPDPRVLELTAPYLLAQGISRVVIEGSLYALPGA